MRVRERYTVRIEKDQDGHIIKEILQKHTEIEESFFKRFWKNALCRSLSIAILLNIFLLVSSLLSKERVIWLICSVSISTGIYIGILAVMTIIIYKNERLF